jgi:hypothetical protein
MKKFLFTCLTLVLFGLAVKAQTTTPTSTVAPAPAPSNDKAAEFDKKFRFGLRITPQPTWYASNDKNNLPYGVNFGLGFGLNMEYRFSEIAAFQFGIGGDFEGGKYTFKNDGSGYTVQYWQNKSTNEFVLPKNGALSNTINNDKNVHYIVSERSVKTTFVTLPLILKLSTKEYGGLKYFGMFGGELGIRAKAKATDTYEKSYLYDANAAITATNGASSQSDIDIGKDASLIPMRFGMNVGAGTEYRIAGSTAFFVSVNYFHSFTNFMRNESKYMVSDVNKDLTAGTEDYKFVKQNLLLNAIRINIGILF